MPLAPNSLGESSVLMALSATSPILLDSEASAVAAGIIRFSKYLLGPTVPGTTRDPGGKSGLQPATWV